MSDTKWCPACPVCGAAGVRDPSRNERWDICIRGSMNLNRNKRWENFDLDEDPALCEFFEKLVSELERISPAGLQLSNAVVDDVFDAALETSTCGDVAARQQSTTERLARLGYTREEISVRLSGAMDEFERGRRSLEDAHREATLSAALGGDARARRTVDKWLRAARGVV